MMPCRRVNAELSSWVRRSGRPPCGPPSVVRAFVTNAATSLCGYAPGLSVVEAPLDVEEQLPERGQDLVLELLRHVRGEFGGELRHRPGSRFECRGARGGERELHGAAAGLRGPAGEQALVDEFVDALRHGGEVSACEFRQGGQRRVSAVDPGEDAVLTDRQ